MDRSDRSTFDSLRPRLLGLAYRMLGSMADAEDAVQDTFLKWQAADTAGIANPEGYLTTVCTNCCLDALKAAHRKRVDYVGPWIPEPLQIDAGSDPEADLERAQSLTTAFLLLMERLSPKERAAYLLREVFGKPYGEVAAAIGVSEKACRQLVSRAGKHVQSPSSRFVPAPDHQQRMLDAFMRAVESGSTEQLSGLLSESVQFQSDGGGKATALGRILEGRGDVAKYVARIMSRLWDGGPVRICNINGVRGLVLLQDERIESALTLGYDGDGRIDRIFIIRNPDKLARLEVPLQHDLKSGALWQ
ncbi:RNA polymerase sigma factor SigJ [Roseibium sediminicola]|uniref:RNA polymerase sigma factor SigJ n=1 Tax=Roseibium sediminicola TaxID=2933272 RepID=A0ABT0H1R0_9HYPH|nr:RNA polymerase sigma factor SigJ [Roseibium sp. CAU 1639]MCK7615616.1 RNA polymerase sigma factor SigJ [Roseibium sp. CAU 1639]